MKALSLFVKTVSFDIGSSPARTDGERLKMDTAVSFRAPFPSLHLMPTSGREPYMAILTMALTLILGVGSLLLFISFPVGLWGAVPMGLSDSEALWWDAFLSFLFFLQHSGMIRRPVRERLAKVVPPSYQRALYSIVSGISLAAVVLLWQPSTSHLLVLGDPLRWLAYAAMAVAVALFMWGAVSLAGLDMLGLAAIRAHMRGTVEPSPTFVVRGPYRWVRHPWYLGAILLLWSGTDLSADRLLLNVLWTAWICLGAHLEERDLRKEFGTAYEAYCRQVPMLIPWHRPAQPVARASA
jgi:protein-S-isoprenylcysteine O-methyltransferase Ste14